MHKPKRITLIFILVLYLLVMWPILTIFSRVEPRILGFPLSVFWPLLIFAVLTVGMIVLTYTAEKEE